MEVGRPLCSTEVSSSGERGLSLYIGVPAGRAWTQIRPQNLSPDRPLSCCRFASAVFAGIFAFPLSPRTVDHLPFKAVLHGVDGGNKKPPICGQFCFRKSPLTDSNRRPPPYHGGFGTRQVSCVCGVFIVLSLLSPKFRHPG